VFWEHLFLHSVRFQTTILFQTKVTFILKVTSVKTRHLTAVYVYLFHRHVCVTNLLWLCVLLSGWRRLIDLAAVSHVKLTVSSGSSCPRWFRDSCCRSRRHLLWQDSDLSASRLQTLHKPASWDMAQHPVPKAEHKPLTITQLSIWQSPYNTILSVPNDLNINHDLIVHRRYI